MTIGGGAYKPGIVLINEELSWARRCHFSPRLNGKFTLATRGRNFPTFLELERKTRRSHTVVGLSKNNNNGGGAYKRRLKSRKECELGRAAADFDILKNRDSRKAGRMGQVTHSSGCRTMRIRL